MTDVAKNLFRFVLSNTAQNFKNVCEIISGGNQSLEESLAGTVNKYEEAISETKSFLVSLENGYNKNKSSTSPAIRDMFPFLKQIDSNLPCVYLVTQKHHFSRPTLNIISVLYIGSQSLAL